MELILNFNSWGLQMNALDGRETFELRRTPQGTEVVFEGRDVVARRGGSLRIGPRDSPRRIEVPFDHVDIPRVAVTEAALQDLQLDVAEARTGGAALSGHAVFTTVFQREPGDQPPGMNLDARWREVGQALARDPNWGELGQRLSALHAGVQTTLRGSFRDLTGTANVGGRGISLRARLLPDRRYTLNAAFDHLDTSPLLPRAQRAQLGGRLDGRLALSARLGAGARDTSVVLDTIELALARDHADAGPRRWVFSRSSAAATRQQLWVTLGEVAFRRGALVVDPLRVQAPSVTLAVRLRAERAATAQRDDRGSSEEDVVDEADVADVAGGSVAPPSGRRRHRRRRRPNDYLVRAWIARDSRVTVRGETFFLPPFLQVEGDPARELAVAPFTIRHRGGGSIDAGGSIRRDGPVDLRAVVRGYPLAHLPGLSDAHAPGRPAGVAVGQVLRGWLNVSLNLGGTEKTPSLSGRLELSDVRWNERALGGGAVVFDGIRDGTRFQGPLLDGITLRGQLTRDPGPQDFVGVTMRDLPLAGWLPPAVAPLGLQASGDVVWRPSAATTRARSIVADLRVRGAGVDAHALARLEPGHDDVTVKTRVALAGMPAAFPALHLRQARGAITAELRWQGQHADRAPRIDGAIVVREALWLWPSSVRAPIEVPRTQVVLGDDEVRVANLVVRAPGAQATLAGRLRLSWADLAASALAGTISVVVDGSKVGPMLGNVKDAVASSGGASFSAAVSGSLRSPHVHGQARFQALTLNWPGSPVGAVRLDGPLAIDDRTLAVGPLLLRLESGGWVLISGPRGPGRVVLTPRRSPLHVSDVDVTVRGGELATLRPTAGVSVHGLGLALHATERRDTILRVAGAVQVGHISYHQGESPKNAPNSAPKRPPAKPAHGPGALDHIRADNIQILGPRDAIKAKVHYVPTVTVGVRCVVDGPLSSPRITGKIEGDGLYSRLALTVGDWFTSRDLHKCDLGPH